MQQHTHLPKPPKPHVYTVPSLASATPWFAPAAICVQGIPARAGIGLNEMISWKATCEHVRVWCIGWRRGRLISAIRRTHFTNNYRSSSSSNNANSDNINNDSDSDNKSTHLACRHNPFARRTGAALAVLLRAAAVNLALRIQRERKVQTARD